MLLVSVTAPVVAQPLLLALNEVERNEAKGLRNSCAPRLAAVAQAPDPSG